ncbi:MAG: hypothetical protein HQM06_17645 [Magnetococcales bacterium]|nr:hypothetical protein [Magnetococcales bacterium]
MKEAANVAGLFDNLPGFSLVDFEEVGLPVYKLTATVLTLMPKHYSPIEEFVLKSIAAGMGTAEDVAGLLGIDSRVVEASLTNLIRDDDVFASAEGILSLTRKSLLMLQGEQAIRPREQAVVFTFDALTRRPRYFGIPLLMPKDLKSRGIREIRAFPSQKPETDEIDVRDLAEALELEAGSRKSDVKILRVREIGRKESHFLPAIMLIYRSKSGPEVRVRFAVDGRLSAEHERAFLAVGGAEKLGIRDAVLDSIPSPSLPDLIGEGLAAEVVGRLSPEEDAAKLKRKASIARFKAEISRKPEPADGGAVVEDPSYAAAIAEAEGAEQELAELRVRPIAVYEHPPLLEDALATAQKRVLIISPWITPAVVNTRFLKQLRDALQRGVEVRIGYGLDDRRQAIPEPNAAESALYELAKREHRLRIVRLGNTHAKVLLKDSEWFVVSSFNWLSFRGDPKRTFREEWGTFVGVAPVVDKYFAEFAPRFDAAGNAS